MLKALRNQRASSIQTVEQYCAVYLLTLEYYRVSARGIGLLDFSSCKGARENELLCFSACMRVKMVSVCMRD